MADLLELAARVEAATGPDRGLDRLIANTWKSGADFQLQEFTSSLDAAMQLAVQGISAPDVLRHAIERCTRYGCPTFVEALPRFVTAEWLRARATSHQQNGVG